MFRILDLQHQDYRMNKLAIMALCTSLAASVGCTQGKPGGPGTDGAAPAYGQSENTFNLSVPMLSSKLQQGSELPATIGIKRAKNFDDDVSLQFSDIPKGVTIEPASPVITRGSADAPFVIKANDEAVVGEYQIKVVGKPSKGGDAEIVFKLSVAAKDSFTLTVPTFSTSLNQGETKTISIGISRQKSFNEPVTLAFGNLPTGVTVELDDPVIEPGDAEAQLTLTAADDASLGSFSIMVTGHPGKGADAVSQLNVTVAKK
jgi:hypothetical protein